MKKWQAVLLVIILVFGCLSVQNGCGKPAVRESGDYSYIVKGDGTVGIVGYIGTASDTDVPEKIDGKAVTSIEEKAFQGSLDIVNVTLPEGIVSLGDYAFECCAHLKSIVLPYSLKTVGKGAFSGCTGLEEVGGGRSVESYGDGAFFYCTSLAKFVFSPKTKTAGDFMLAECHRLTDVQLNDGLQAVSDRMFYGCMMLTTTDIPDSVTRIGNYAFAQIDEFMGIKGGVSVTDFGKYALSGMMPEYTLCDKVTTIPTTAMIRCYMMESLNIPASVTDLQPNALPPMLSEITVDENNPVYTAVDNVVFTKDMKTLVYYAPNDAKESYVIPETVTHIAPYAMSGLINLTKLTIPEGVEYIGEYAFKDTSRIDRLVIPDSVTTYCDHCFENCGIREIAVGKGMEKVGAYAFANSYSTEKIDLPDTVTAVGERAFSNAHGLLRLDLPAELSEFDITAISGLECPVEFVGKPGSSDTPDDNPKAICKTDTAIITADGKEIIKIISASDAFTVPDGVEKIGKYAFADTNVKTVTIPDSVKEIDEYAMGYTWRVEEKSIEAYPVVGFKIFCSEKSEAARKYAADNDFGCFSAEPEINKASLSLAGDETFDLSVSNTFDGDVCYSSAESSIASVDENGRITAHSEGTTNIVASVGSVYFKCDVTVTSDGKENKNAFDDSKYRRFERGETAAWVESYTDFNKDVLSFDPDDNRFTCCYKGENYYEGMWAAQLENSDYDALAVDMFGEGFKDQLAMMDHGLDVELGRYRQPDDIVLYSGTADFSRFIGNVPSTVKNMKAAIGTTAAEPYFFSTAIDHDTAQNFGGSFNCVFEIYAGKEYVNGGYIECTAANGDGGEYELLFPGNVSFEILDAGVRETDVVSLNPMYDGNEHRVGFERFMKVRLVAAPDGRAQTSTAQTIFSIVLALAAVTCVIALIVKKKK